MLIRPCLVLFALLTLITGVLYPLAVTLIAQVAFPVQAAGSLVRDGNTVRGSLLIGQAFTAPGYFWSRPSATGPVANNANASSGSNLGPVNPALLTAVSDRVAAVHAADPTWTGPVPGDLVTASGSGLDPHLSPAAVRLQITRVAAVRKLDRTQVAALVESQVLGRQFGILGEPRVNVLALNLAVDKLAAQR